MAQYASFVQIKEKWVDLKDSGFKLMLIPIKVSEFYCLRYNKYLKKHIGGEGCWKSDHVDLDYKDPGIESFVQFTIPPECIDFDLIIEYEAEKIPRFIFEPKKV